MKLQSYKDFLSEAENVKLDKELREYVLTHVKDAMFKLKSSDYYKEFSVTPYKKETLDTLKETRYKLEDAIKDLGVQEMYAAVVSAERVPYTFGNVFPAKFSLKTVPEISIGLEQDQQRVLATSEKEFLTSEFSTLNKQTKDSIIEALRERCEVLCAVLEALFYYIRKIDTENFYDGMNKDEIAEHYESLIKKSTEEVSFSFDGPFESDLRSPINKETKVAFWVCEKDMKKFVIKGTIDPAELKSEDNVGGTEGMKFSIMLEDQKLPEKDYNYFSVDELSARIKMFNNKILKKI